MLYAAVRHAPSFGGEVAAFSLKGGGARPKDIEEGVIVPGGIAVLGASWWQANRFLDERPRHQVWRDGPQPTLDSSATLWKRYEGLLTPTRSGRPDAFGASADEQAGPATRA